MAEVSWPNNLQQLLNAESFSEKIGETVLRSDMDVGPAKVRRRFTKSVDTITCSINLETIPEYTAFKLFFKNTVNGGATRFEFLHPVTGELLLVRFTEPPEIVPMGGTVFRASMQWEILP